MGFEFLDSLKKDIFYSDKELYDDLEEYSLIEDAKQNNLLNFYAKAGFLRGEKEDEIINLFMAAYDENPLSAMKLLFYVRDKEEGLGERRIFRVILNHLAKIKSSYLAANIDLIPIYGRWDDLYSLFDTEFQYEAINIIREQIEIDLKSENPSTLSKWLKSENASSQRTKELARKTRIALDLSSKEYRVLLSHLRKRVNIVEDTISKGNWDEVKYEDLSSSAIRKYNKAFLKHDKERYIEYLNKIQDEKVVEEQIDENKDELYPYDIINHIINDATEYSKVYYSERWNEIPTFTNSQYGDTLVCLGLSSKSVNKNLKPAIYYGGIGTSLYLLDKNKDKYKNYVITMVPKPNLVRVKGDKLISRIKDLTEKSLTEEINVDAALDLILFAAIKNGINQENIPRRVLFILDDKCKIIFTSENNSNEKKYFLDEKDYRKIKEKWSKSGYEIPNLCFWKIDSYRENSKILEDSNGFQYASGYSNEMFKFIMNGQDISSSNLDDEVLLNIRYNKVYNGD
ncbi:DUF2828 domain-containing protein [Clostridium sp. SHJSY1]|uniref:DUF2828 family protein n=1 Tax=Clostridium sp. SHJSY1 TaxID=2942483 RepID=UPI002875A6EA|nr:DUF2828 family protein [Clostridium sp. SHJSY1]MDS0527354.1 DUF2828 domain-containing protein [Clostridium sp. SHJSY1]